MLDKIRFSTSDFIVNTNFSGVVEPSSYKYNSGEITDEFAEFSIKIEGTDRALTGKKIYINHEKFNASIISGINRDGEKKIYLVIYFNPTKLCNGHNCENVPIEKFTGQPYAIQEIIKLAGIEFDWKNVNYSRVDVGVNIETEKPIPVYLDYLSEEVGKYRRQRVQYESETLYYRNSNRQTLFYNKIHEQISKGEFIPREYTDSRLLRAEEGFKKSALLKAFDFTDLNSVKNQILLSIKNLKKFLRKQKFGQTFDTKNLELFFEGNNSRYQVNDFLISAGLYYLKTGVNQDWLISEIKKYSSRNTAARIKNKLSQTTGFNILEKNAALTELREKMDIEVSECLK